MANGKWHSKKVEDIERELGTDVRAGLSAKEAAERLKRYRNVIQDTSRQGVVPMFLGQFKDTMVMVLLGAAVLSGILGDLVDAVTIIVIVVMNGILGFIQEYRAEKSLEAIKKLASPAATVVRDGRRLRIPAEEVVPGDLILLEAGDRVPADIRLLECFNLEIEESALTGESLPVGKLTDTLPENTPLAECTNMAFMGTVITRGRGSGIAVATGMNTVVGEIAAMIQKAGEDATPLQQRLAVLGRVLVLICITACLGVVILGLYRGENLIRMVLAGVSLAVAAVPEGLPAIVTVVLALGVQRMAKRRAIVRKLPAVETLGCTTVICSDKTGTLTQNQMTVRYMASLDKVLKVTGDGYTPEGEFLDGNSRVNPAQYLAFRIMLETSVYCNHAEITGDDRSWDVQGDPTEAALLVATRKAKIVKEKGIVREIPFDSERKMMSVVVPYGRGYRVFVKGALEALLPCCKWVQKENRIETINYEHIKLFSKYQEEWAEQAYRVLAFAYRDIGKSELQRMTDQDIEKNLVLVGLCGMMDPPRSTVPDAVSRCLRAGIVPVMITGDHPSTARAIAHMIGLTSSTHVLGPHDIENMTLRELGEMAVKHRVFARVSPQHKLKIVKALKTRGHIVAMTGDGVNDAPAVKEADIGISMGVTGTEVTKEASAMILADDDFSTIVAAVHEGRAIYDNIRKFIRYLLGGNIGEVLTMFMASLLGMPIPLLPLQILWVNLVTDGLPAMALGVEPPEPDVMERSPRNPNENVLSRGLGWEIANRGIFIGVVTLLAFFIGLTYERWLGIEGFEIARTMAFSTLVFAQLFYVFDCRSEHYSPFEIGFFGNSYLIAAVLCSVVMLLLTIYCPPLQPVFGTAPLNAWQWALVLALTGGRMMIRLVAFWRQGIALNSIKYGKLESVGVNRR